MSDRRQGDRRDTSKMQKKLSISLGNFIFIIIIFILIIVSIFLCSYIETSSFNKGYNEGYSEGYYHGSNDYYFTSYEQDSLYYSDPIDTDNYDENL